ncbi:MAG: outer membrane protein assembly factor BamD [Gammaproteobacteria bacterium]
MRRLTPLLILVFASAAILAGCAHGPEKIQPETVLYKRAQDALTTQNWNRATGSLRSMISTYPFGKYATQGRLDLIYAYYRNNQTDETAKQADDFVKENPASPYAAYAMFMKGVAYANALQRGPVDAVFHVNLSDRDPLDQKQAYTAFKQLIKRYPNSRYAHQAKQWMVFVRNRMAQFNLNLARFYQRRNEWVAAAMHASDIVTQFSDTEAAQPALRIMARSYKALGETELAADARAWYDYNYGNKSHHKPAPAASTASSAGH